MKIKNTWIFGIFLGFILAYSGWNIYKTDVFLLQQTEVISGKIIDVFPSKELKSYNRRIKYVYSVNDIDYVDFKKLGTKDEKQVIGNELRIRYSAKNPKRNKVEVLKNNYRNSNSIKYYSNTENGYIEMNLINGVFKYTEFAEKGKIINNFIGDYKIYYDSIQFNHYRINPENTDIQKSTTYLFNPRDGNQLIEKQTKRIFKRLKSKR